MPDFPRLIEHAFSLKRTSLGAALEKSVRDGHICTLHIWPARRPLAARLATRRSGGSCANGSPAMS